jgi:acetamidase/formamidase
MSANRIGREIFHYKWNREHKAALTIEPGESVDFEVNEVSSWQITKDAKADRLVGMDANKLYPLSGPVFIEGAEEGDALEIEVEEIETADWGWSAIIPGLGLLPEFNEPYLFIWNLQRGRKYAEFKNGIRVPLGPFCGVMGVAPKEPGELDVLPPGKHGGNMDIKHLTAGSKLLLPVWVDGGLFSVGDMHAGMGDGEVCVTAIECPGRVKLKFDLIKQASISFPRLLSKGSTGDDSRGFFVTTGIAPDLMEACRLATRELISYLGKQHGLTREDAYILCSVAADLKVHEVVDTPNWVVGLWIAKSILGLE